MRITNVSNMVNIFMDFLDFFPIKYAERYLRNVVNPYFQFVAYKLKTTSPDMFRVTLMACSDMFNYFFRFGQAQEQLHLVKQSRSAEN